MLYEAHERDAAKTSRNFGKQLAKAFSNGVDAFLDFSLFLVSIWPFMLIFGLLWYFRGRIRWRFWRQKS